MYYKCLKIRAVEIRLKNKVSGQFRILHNSELHNYTSQLVLLV
jgi:hypothetical protein